MPFIIMMIDNHIQANIVSRPTRQQLKIAGYDKHSVASMPINSTKQSLEKGDQLAIIFQVQQTRRCQRCALQRLFLEDELYE